MRPPATRPHVADPGAPTAKVASASPLGPDDATRLADARRFLDVLIAAAAVGGMASVGVAVASGTLRAWAVAILLGVLTAWLVASPRPGLDRRPVDSVMTRVSIALIAAIVGITLLEPYLAVIMTSALLIPIAAALPYVEAHSLRRLFVLAWVAASATVAADFLPDDSGVPAEAVAFGRFFGVSVVVGLVLLLLYRSSENLKASGREFRRLFELSADLAESTEPGVLGELVARHLAEATGFEECLIYALAPATGRLAPFGSHPVERSLETDPESIADRPMLGRVIHDRARVIIDASDERADPAERARLHAHGRQVMLLLPLVAQSDPVGVAELTTRGSHAIDERRLALAGTLAFEAALAIENGRLYMQLRERALHDPLTGLANRSLFFDRVEHALARLARREEAVVSVLFIDLDDFKAVNDTYGHARGDRLLVLIGERLRTVVRPSDTVARLGGDEFALLLEELATADEALVVSGRVLRSFEAPFDLAGQVIAVSVSIGVTLRSAAGATPDELVAEADVAMYEAKRSGKGRVVRFSPGLEKLSATRPGQLGSRLGTTSDPSARRA